MTCSYMLQQFVNCCWIVGNIQQVVLVANLQALSAARPDTTVHRSLHLGRFKLLAEQRHGLGSRTDILRLQG